MWKYFVTQGAVRRIMLEFPGLLISNPTITAAPVCVDPLQGVGGFVHICSRGRKNTSYRGRYICTVGSTGIVRLWIQYRGVLVGDSLFTIRDGRMGGGGMGRMGWGILVIIVIVFVKYNYPLPYFSWYIRYRYSSERNRYPVRYLGKFAIRSLKEQFYWYINFANRN